MTATIIDESNISAFIPGFEGEIGDDDLFIGVYDEESDTAVGAMAVSRVSDTEAEIRDVFVSEDYRDQGAGSEMIAYLQDFAYDAGIEALLCIHEREYDGDPVSRFLERNGFAENEDVTTGVYSTTVGELMELDFTKVAIRVNELADSLGVRVRSLDKVDDDFWKTMEEQWGEVPELSDDALFFTGVKDRLVPEYSFAAIDPEGVVGVLAVSREDEDYRLEGLRVRGEHANDMSYLLMKKAIGTAKDNIDADARVLVSPMTKESMELMEYVTEGNYIMERENVLYVWEAEEPIS
ncbi:MAG: GNAT family N-acetyltransferase [Lachnospiraceae bacterium]|nr:GNAT family N-acetyltransferase [Lachnospiraceae bacterium]